MSNEKVLNGIIARHTERLDLGNGSPVIVQVNHKAVAREYAAHVTAPLVEALTEARFEFERCGYGDFGYLRTKINAAIAAASEPYKTFFWLAPETGMRSLGHSDPRMMANYSHAVSADEQIFVNWIGAQLAPKEGRVQ
jgi:hypothetical protein